MNMYFIRCDGPKCSADSKASENEDNAEGLAEYDGWLYIGNGHWWCRSCQNKAARTRAVLKRQKAGKR